MPARRVARETDLGTEQQCTKCCEFWPADGEFFYSNRKGLYSYCKACYFDMPSVRAKLGRGVPKREAPCA